jgi:hypothetical protein
VIAAHIGAMATVAFLTWVLSALYWFDVWRLGSAEGYGVLGFALWALGIHLLWPVVAPVGRAGRWRQRVGVFLFVVGNAVVVGSKETLVIIAVPNLFLAIRETQAGRLGGARWWACAVAVLTAVAVVMPLLVFFSRAPVDTYGRSVTAPALIAVLMPAALRLTTVHVAAVAAALLWIAVRFRARWRSSLGPAGRELTSRLVLVSAVALGLYLSQVVLYNGDITPHTRYEFPAALALPGLLVAVAVCLQRFFHATSSRRGERIVQWSTAAVFFGLAVLAAPGLGDQRTRSRDWARTTREFTADITAAAATARVAPEVPIVVVSGRPIDMEPIVSIERFLRALGADNPRFLVLDWQRLRSQWIPREAFLAPTVEAWARDGALGYEPIARLRPGARCFSIGLTGPPRDTCQELARR